MAQNKTNISPIDLSFPKREKLCSVKEIENLFKEGNSLLIFPIKAVYKIKLSNNNEPINRVAFSVSKRRFKSAVKRNRIKRLMREAYRLNKQLLQNEKSSINCFFIYVNDSALDFSTVQTAMIKLLQKIKETVPEN